MDGWINIGTKIDTKSFDAQIKYIEQKMKIIEKTLAGGDVVNAKQLRAEYEKLANQLIQINKQQAELNNGPSGISTSIKKAGKWALAIFGVRSAYMGIRQSIGYVSQYNDEMANKINSIKMTLASAIEPLLERIVNIVYKLVQYAAYLIKEFTGKDILAEASKNISKANKQAKELKKTLSGFDTAQVLSSTSSGSSTSTINPIKPLEDSEVPNWLKWIADNGEYVAIIIGTITAAILLLKLTALSPLIAVVAGLLAYLIVEIVKNWDTIKQKTKDMLTAVAKFFTDTFQKIVTSVRNLIARLIEPFKTWFSGIKGVLNGILEICKGNFASGLTQIFKGLANMLIGVVNVMINGINGVIAPIRSLIVVAGKILGKNWTMDNIRIPTIPKLAVGGIVNNPGRGVPVGSAIAGEAGREGVLPLTDSQAMAQLGAEIGKWISVNVDLTTKLDSRVLSRSLEKVQSNNNFARNGV